MKSELEKYKDALLEDPINRAKFILAKEKLNIELMLDKIAEASELNNKNITMEEILKYENRDNLYKFLIEDFGFVKVNEKYEEQMFGNFYITLESQDFFITYINDRSHLNIEITSKQETSNSYSLSFVQSLIYDPININSTYIDSNIIRIEDLNDFLKNDYTKICELFNKYNYWDTKNQIDSYLMKTYKKRNPDWE